jgi:glycosyltransferase involved in cell wall biosynthesis
VTTQAIGRADGGVAARRPRDTGRKVLLISYTFPPQYDVSARRATKLCKYLPAAGWRPIVLTKDWERGVAPEDRRAYAIVMHPGAFGEIHGVEIVRAPYRTHDNAIRRLHERLGGAYDRDPCAPNRSVDDAAERSLARDKAAAARWTPRALVRRALSLSSPAFGDFPDAFRGWVDAAVRAGVEIVRRESIDVICSLCPPASAHVVASEIARRTDTPWVAQFDDLYGFHLERQRRTAWRPYADWRHRRWMHRATFAGAITPAMLAYVRRTYGIDGDVVVVGFDPDDQPPARPPRNARMRLAYTGSIYPGDQRPEVLFEALERLHVGGASPPIEVVFAGTGRDDELRSQLRAFANASRICTFVDRLPPVDALRLQREADALVLLNCTNPSPDEGTLSYPSKAFEYLNAGRPILGLPRDPGGWGDSLLETTRAGVTAESAADVAGVLHRWLAAWREYGTLPYDGNADEIARYSQPRQAQALAVLFERAVQRRFR